TTPIPLPSILPSSWHSSLFLASFPLSRPHTCSSPHFHHIRVAAAPYPHSSPVSPPTSNPIPISMAARNWRSNEDKGNNPSPSSSTLSTLPPTISSLPSSPTTVQTPQTKTPVAVTIPVALTIPEIILSIAAFLSRPSLLYCALVCKDWHVIFQALLFRVVVAADFDRPDFVRAFQKSTRFATSIEWIQEPQVIPAAPRDHFWHRLFPREAPTKLITHIRKPFEQLESYLTAGQTPLLELLSVRIWKQDPNLIFRLSASTVINLQISTLGHLAGKPRMYLEDILQAYPNLINLTLEGLFTLASHLYEEGPLSKGKGVVRPSSIQTLNLRLVDISQNGLIALSALLRNLTALLIEEYLVPDVMRIYRWTWSSEFIQNLRSDFPHLQSIRFALPFENINENMIIKTLKSFPLLTTVGFRNAYFGKRAMETLQEHCKYVECLDVSFGNAGRRELEGALLGFLQTWPRLRELEADGVIFKLDEPVDAGVTKALWACTKLEKLVCGFRGTESMIFQHLSQFPMLSHLTITTPALKISPIKSTLAWMVKSTRMEHFRFASRRNVPLNKATIRWTLQHWPNLKTLHVAGKATDQRAKVKQWCREAQRLGFVIEYDRM
ncbi:hypothetical protein EDD21DRAFT_424286, partial [Dissophora ornata]